MQTGGTGKASADADTDTATRINIIFVMCENVIFRSRMERTKTLVLAAATVDAQRIEKNEGSGTVNNY